MNKLFISFLLFVPMVASADYLNDKWTNLVKEKQELISELEKCQKNTKGFKIAGLATLGVSAIGIGVNIGEAVRINSLEDEINRAKNTCGTAKCEGTASIANATKHVCINGVWKVETCAATHKGQNEGKCKRDGKDITYYDGCVEAARQMSAVFPDGYDPNALGPSVVTVGNRQWAKLLAKCDESDNCNGDAGEELGAVVGGEPVCINGKWWSKGGECPEGYSRETNECDIDGEEIVYIRDCQKHRYLSSIEQDQDHVNIGVDIDSKKGKNRNIVHGGSAKAAPDIGPCSVESAFISDVLKITQNKADALPWIKTGSNYGEGYNSFCNGVNEFYEVDASGDRIGDGCVKGCDRGVKMSFSGGKKLCVSYSAVIGACMEYCKNAVMPQGDKFRIDACRLSVAGVVAAIGTDKCLCNALNASYKFSPEKMDELIEPGNRSQ